MRTKEDADDYRYFSDPDLLPLIITEAQIQKLKSAMPELPQEKQERFQQELELSAYDATQLTSQRATTDYFETALAALDGQQAKLIANWILTDLAAALNRAELEIQESPVRPERSEERRVGAEWA